MGRIPNVRETEVSRAGSTAQDLARYFGKWRRNSDKVYRSCKERASVSVWELTCPARQGEERVALQGEEVLQRFCSSLENFRREEFSTVS
jgi:hypothetical protein